jgi:steroid 5-alpha reductase family enzyme
LGGVCICKSWELLKIRYSVIFFILSITFILSYLTPNYLQEATLEFSEISLIYYLWIWIFAIQIIVFIPSFIFRTEHYYDLTGGITYISTILTALFFKKSNLSLDLISLLIGSMVIIWASRLSLFLFLRVKKSGEDIRFKKIKHSFSWFLMTFMLQGMWVFMCLFPALIVMSSYNSELNGFAVIGAVIWVFGFLFEVVADNQKSNFNKNNKGKFMSTGLWSVSRHPNYFGEFMLWLGITIASFGYLDNYNYIILLTPVFVYLLLTRVSGVNLLEEIAEKRWGNDKNYKEYKKRTPIFFPKFF